MLIEKKEAAERAAREEAWRLKKEAQLKERMKRQIAIEKEKKQKEEELKRKLAKEALADEKINETLGLGDDWT